MNDCCSDCFDDTFLKEFIKEKGRTGDCGYCGSSSTDVASVKEVGELLVQTIEKHFRPAVFPEDSLMNLNPQVDPLSLLYWLRNETRTISAKLIDAQQGMNEEEDPLIHFTMPDTSGCNLINDLLSAVNSQTTKDKDGMLSRGWTSRVEPNLTPSLDHFAAWSRARFSTSHYLRFFDDPNSQVNRIKMLEPVRRSLEQAEDTLAAGTTLWRARRVGDKQLPTLHFPGWGGHKPTPEALKRRDDMLREIEDLMGPPPVKYSGTNRMSPAGISYMYVSDNEDVCISEIRPNVGEFIWLAEFVTTKQLRLVNLTKASVIEPRLLFDPEFTAAEISRSTFLEKFSSELSRPISTEESALDYVPSQVICEYIRLQGYDGVAFASSVRKGTNFVLFVGPRLSEREQLYLESGEDPDPRLPPFTDWMATKEVCRRRVDQLSYTLEGKPDNLGPYNSVSFPAKSVQNA